MKKKVKVTVRIALLVTVAAIIGINVYSINATRLAGDSVPMPFGVGAAVVLSGSMEPSLSVGDMLVVVPQESYRENDVVVFQRGRSSVVHRIISIEGDEIITKGDANNTADEPISPKAIKGEVVAAIPLVGYAVNAIKTPVGTLCILALAVLLLERSFHSEKKKDEQELEAIRAEIERLKQNQKPTDKDE